ncbi:hypothetical protein LWI29_016239 [Acer saccharum]|uniref:Uncharacterized protein n=1 Tax=Acer saccharum TaxID=4024 RepID=A0AA39RJU3_ACESA|nr:hypothetical protein LWI29_016239 [Acer saccharum]
MSKWDLKETSKSSHSNIQSFIDSVTPTVPTTTQQGKVTEKVEECFSFKDLWEFYLGWSIYGHLPNSTEEEENMSGGSKGNNLGIEIKIPPFAMASYKMFGTLWTNPGSSDQNTIHSHLNAAASWLNQQNFLHSDFNFFVSRRQRRY